MTPEQYRRASIFMQELEPIEKMLNTVKHNKPQIEISFGALRMALHSSTSPDGNKELISAIEKELQARVDSLKDQLKKK